MKLAPQKKIEEEEVEEGKEIEKRHENKKPLVTHSLRFTTLESVCITIHNLNCLLPLLRLVWCLTVLHEGYV